MMRWRRWSDRSQVERVELYTRQSLYVLLWLIPATVLLRLLGPSAADPRAAVAVLLATVLLAAVTTWLMRAVFALHPATGPLPVRRMAVTGVLAVIAGAVVLVVGADPVRGAGAIILVSVVVWGYGGLRDRRVTAALLVLAAGFPALAAREWGVALFGLGLGAFIIFTVRSSLWLLGVVTELAAARDTRAALAVAEERLRFSRDVHDVLGRRLSTIGVQAELAAALAVRGDPTASDRMLAVRSTAHEALREARELARGYRATELAQEVAGAGSLLRAADIQCEVDLDGLPTARHEAAGWVVREAVTNVLRHSRAGWVRIRYADGLLAVTNDGAPAGAGSPVMPDAPGGAGGSPPGAGLAGLAERLQPLDVDLEAGPLPGDRFEVRARFAASEVPMAAGGVR